VSEALTRNGKRYAKKQMQTRDAGWTGTGKSMVCWTKKGTKRRKVKEKEGKARQGEGTGEKGRREVMGEEEKGRGGNKRNETSKEEQGVETQRKEHT